MARHIKSERLKKLETEFNDLRQWLKLGLVPKKDLKKHKDEIQSIQNKIEDEKERLQFLRESGEVEEYIAPKRSPARSGYSEMPSLPDMDVGDTATAGGGDSEYGAESESRGETTTAGGEEDTGAGGDEEEVTQVEEESYFSDKNRWSRGVIVDPDVDDW